MTDLHAHTSGAWGSEFDSLFPSAHHDESSHHADLSIGMLHHQKAHHHHMAQQQQAVMGFDMPTHHDAIPPQPWTTAPFVYAPHAHLVAVPPVESHHYSPSHSRDSHCSSPNSSLPLDEPVWLDEELQDHSESESSATSIHASHASTPHEAYSSPSTASTPVMQVSHLAPSVVSQMHAATMSTNTMPTINELSRPVAMRQESAELLELPAGGIGMLQPLEQDSIMTSAPVSSASSVVDTNDRPQVRARRRTRYTTAAAASVAARTSVQHTPSRAPTLQHASSRDSANMDITSNGSAQSSEQDEEEEMFDQEDDEYDEDASPGKSAKRKRGGAFKSSNSSNAEHDSPQMKGLDKRERNKLSASMYRKRRKVYLDSLEGKVGELDQTIAKQSETIARQAHENKVLKEQLSFLKKMMAGIKNPLGSSSSAAAAAAEEHQPSNIHTGARRTMSNSAGAFLFVVAACCLLVFCGSPDSDSSDLAPIGRRGRTLLSVDDTLIESSYSFSASLSADSGVASYSDASSMFATPAAFLSDHVVAPLAKLVSDSGADVAFLDMVDALSTMQVTSNATDEEAAATAEVKAPVLLAAATTPAVHTPVSASN